tara:strand:- start:130 stop:1854 length:1725 start_codon:yes stop_codon:yes gene_type:complete
MRSSRLGGFFGSNNFPSQRQGESRVQVPQHFTEFETIVEGATQGRLKAIQNKAIQLNLTEEGFKAIIDHFKTDSKLMSTGFKSTIDAFDKMLARISPNDDKFKRDNKDFLDALDQNSRAFASPGPARQGGSAQVSLDFSTCMAQNLDPKDQQHLKDQFGSILNLLQTGAEVLFPSDTSNKSKGLLTNLGLGIANKPVTDPLIASIQNCIKLLQSQNFSGLSFGTLSLKNAQNGIYQVWGAKESNMLNPQSGLGQAVVAVEINNNQLGNTLIPINTMGWSSSSSFGLSGQASEQPVSRSQASSSSRQYFSEFETIVEGATQGRLKAIQNKAKELNLTTAEFSEVIQSLKINPRLRSFLQAGFSETIKAFETMLAGMTANDDDHQQANKEFLDALDQNSLSRFSDLTLQDKHPTAMGIMDNWDSAFLKLSVGPEKHHDFVQILFPNRKPGVAHKSLSLGDGQRIINDLIKLDFREKLKSALPVMLSHWGFQIDSDGNVTLDQTKTSNRKSYVIKKDHNQLRISRVLECLRLFKSSDPYLKQVSNSLFTQLETLVQLNQSNSDLSQSMVFWSASHRG